MGASWDNKIPARIKFGLDVGISGQNSKLLCNICFNTRMGNPLLENKPGSFHWAPIFNKRNYVLTLGNFSSLKNYKKEVNLELNFYRIEDSKTFTEKYMIAFLQSLKILVSHKPSSFWVITHISLPLLQIKK